ncbi:hypothetical protein [Bradyrhizobium sp. CCGUVB23]|uniref:hypothetical protein n=1 Tax=Bradyrhizobium sp. CCGUVB23 TaxID=2949630 RepID=UPI0020B2325A|nr:hypothetical protein [Bradyrhizobium sp. CCGUVB23]MCP3461772.1 hypothetical protein [Bradyrhizobium sp. CCGUVB23]
MITNIDGDPKFLGNRVSRVSGHNADFLVIFGQPDFQIKLLEQAAEVVDWKPTMVLSDAAVSIAKQEMGTHNGIFSLANQRIRIVLTSAESEEWEIFKSRYLPDTVSPSEAVMRAYLQARSTVALLQGCAGNLTSQCIQRDFEAAREERARFGRALHLMRFNGQSWDIAAPSTRY